MFSFPTYLDLITFSPNNSSILAWNTKCRQPPAPIYYCVITESPLYSNIFTAVLHKRLLKCEVTKPSTQFWSSLVRRFSYSLSSEVDCERINAFLQGNSESYLKESQAISQPIYWPCTGQQRTRSSTVNSLLDRVDMVHKLESLIIVV